MSRPTKYSNEILEFAKQYIEDFERDGSVIPSIAGLALRLGIRRETLHVWKNDESKKEFSNTLEMLLCKQEQLLLNRGLSGKFNSALVKLALGNHGYSSKKDTSRSGPDGGPVEVSPVWEVLPVASNHRAGKRGS